MSRPGSWLRWAGPVLVLGGGAAAGIIARHPIGWALVAGTVLLLVLGATGKRWLGVVLTSLAVLLTGFSFTASPLDWPSGLAGLGATLGGGLVIRTAGHWGNRGSRFERGRARVDAGASPLEVWKAMDDGHDPTEVDPR